LEKSIKWDFGVVEVCEIGKWWKVSAGGGSYYSGWELGAEEKKGGKWVEGVIEIKWAGLPKVI
jgi:hypothetical protein